MQAFDEDGNLLFSITFRRPQDPREVPKYEARLRRMEWFLALRERSHGQPVGLVTTSETTPSRKLPPDKSPKDSVLK